MRDQAEDVARELVSGGLSCELGVDRPCATRRDVKDGYEDSRASWRGRVSATSPTSCAGSLSACRHP